MEERDEMQIFCCYSSSDNINCHSIPRPKKKYANKTECTLDFSYSTQFYVATSSHGMMVSVKDLTAYLFHIYIICDYM